MRIYLDHNATTPVRAEVVEAMTAALAEQWGNPSSVHAEGAAARRVLDRARAQAAAAVGVAPAELVFTGSASEANNTALAGLLARAGGRRRVVTTAIEHPSVDEPLRALEAAGAPVVRVGVDAGGRVDPAELAERLDDATALVAVILANNETGVIQDVPAIAAAARARGIPVHVDATQALGKLRVRLAELGASTLAASAHKLGGAKGTGLLALAPGLALEAFVRGGPQERRRRGGTENVAGIAGFGVACALAEAELPTRAARHAALRDRLWQGIEKRVPRVRRNGDPEHLLPNTLNVEFCGTAGEILLEALDGEGIAVSAGAACASGSIEPSPVLLAMGRTPDEARGSLRFSVGHGNDAEQIDRVLAVLPGLVERVRRVSS